MSAGIGIVLTALAIALAALTGVCIQTGDQVLDAGKARAEETRRVQDNSNHQLEEATRQLGRNTGIEG